MGALDDIKSITNNKGVTFSQFCAEVAAEKQTMLTFTFKPQPSDPTLKDKDNADTVTYIARAGYIHSKARAFALKAKGVATWSIMADTTIKSGVAELAKKYTADFEEEVGDWEAISDALHERLWTGRGEMRRLNRGEG